MANAVWPAGLPQSPRLRELDETPPAPIVRTAMDVGPDKVRQRATAGVTTFSIAIPMSRDQIATFDAFFRTTCLHGAEPFTWRHPRTNNDIDYRFVGQPHLKPLAPRQSGVEIWVATFTLEALPGTEVTTPPPPPPPSPPPGEGEIFIFEGESGGGVVVEDAVTTFAEPDTLPPSPDEGPFIGIFDDPIGVGGETSITTDDAGSSSSSSPGNNPDATPFPGGGVT